MSGRLAVVNRRVNPLLSSLPDWVETIRPHQIRAVREVLERFEDTRLVFLDAPTGTGKTLIAESVRRMMSTRAVYTCTTKSLQQQFARDFEYARVMMGRVNYPTVNLADEFPDVTCEDCTIQSGSCRLCPDVEECPYARAKEDARTSDLAVLNTSYLLNETRGVHSAFTGRPLMIMDEADLLEAELMRNVSVEVSQGRMRKWGWKPPEKVTVVESWREWLEQHLDRLKHVPIVEKTPLTRGRELRFRQRLRAGMKEVLDGLDTGVWVFTGREGEVSFKPSRVDGYGQRLWDISKRRWLLMSATPISVEERLDALGWDERYGVVKVESLFPVENRRVRYVPVGSMGAKTKTMTLPKMTRAVGKILERHANERVLVHTVSYVNTKDMAVELGRTMQTRPLLAYNTSRDRAWTLDEYLKKDAAVLLAPSMERGIDLPNDACRVQIIIKIPYPYLGDRQVSARLHSPGGKVWYLCETIRTLVQMTGRAIRHREDWAETWVLDEDFENLWNRGRSLFPKWWSDAVVWKPETWADI